MDQRTTALPFLPGNSFSDPTKSKYHRSQTLKYRCGYSLPVRPTVAIGGDKITINQLTENDLDELSNTRPTLTYGNVTRPAQIQFIPAHVAFDKKVLKFDAYFKQTVHESPQEYYRITTVKIFYYLEDDSIAVVEPPVSNSGIPQGKLIKRQRLPKNDLGECWHWKDLNIGIDVSIYGKMFHIYNCDQWTKEFMSSEGIELNPPEPQPLDPYIQSRNQPLHVYKSPSTYDNLKQFIEMDRKVLRFYCVWDDRDSMFGEIKPYIVHYYLVDDTVEVREVHEPNDGRDPFPVLLCRQKLPKDRSALPSTFPSCVFEVSEDEVSEWLSPKDLGIGKTININERKFLIYDCDEFTREYYSTNHNIEQPNPISISKPSPIPVNQDLPPYNGFGSLEDSKQSCLSLIPQPPKKDFIKMLENDGKILRYAAVMDSLHSADQNRCFIISFWLSDDTMSIYEPSQRNSGIHGGQFLERTKVAKPGSSTDNPDFYKPQDLAIGSKIKAFKHCFIITDADEYVLKYMKERSQEFPQDMIDALEKKHKN